MSHRNPSEILREISYLQVHVHGSYLLMAFLLSANALAFQVGTPSVVHSRVSCVAPAVTMAIPWKIAGAVTVAGGAAAGATYAVKALLKKQATTQAEDSRKALASMGGMDLPSGDLLDKEVEDPFVILGSDGSLNAGAGAATEAEPTLALVSQAIGRRSPPSPAARGMRARSLASRSGGHRTRCPSWRRPRPRSEALASDCRECQSGFHAHGYFLTSRAPASDAPHTSFARARAPAAPAGAPPLARLRGSGSRAGLGHDSHDPPPHATRRAAGTGPRR